MVTERVRSYLPIITAELERGGYPFPPALILSIIQAESGGDAEEVNEKSGASGLMQLMPVAVRDYNQRNKTDYKMEDIRGASEQAAIANIRIGLNLLGEFWRGAYRYLKRRIGAPPLDDLAQISQMFYVMGGSGAKKVLNTMSNPTFASVAKTWPNKSWVLYIKKIWRLTGDQNPVWNMDAIDRWVDPESIPDKPPLIAKTPRNGFLLAVLVIAVASAYLKKK